MDDASGNISIAMEICEGGSLDGVYREVKKLGGRTGEKVLGKVAEGVLNGLTYLHGQKIIHRGKWDRHKASMSPPLISRQTLSHRIFSYAGTVR